MIFINNDDFVLENTDNFYTNLNEIPKTSYNSNSYDVKLVNSVPQGFNYAETYFNVNEADGYDMIYGTISINNNDDLNSATISKTKAFWGEKITININRNEYYFVIDMQCDVTDSAI